MLNNNKNDNNNTNFNNSINNYTNKNNKTRNIKIEKKNINNINLIKTTENTYKNLDVRILPLFRLPVHLKNLHDKNISKYNINVLDLDTNKTKGLTNNNIISLKSNLDILLKTLNLYQVKLNNEINSKNKLTLILKLKQEKNNILNIILNNYYYSIKLFRPIFKIRSLLYNIQLFLLKPLLKPHPMLRFKYRLRYITKNYVTKLLFTNKYKHMFAIDYNKFKQYNIIKNSKLNRQLIFKLLVIGNKIINILNSQILLKKILINQLKIKKFLNINKGLFYKITNTNEILTNTHLNNNNSIKNNNTNVSKIKNINFYEDNRVQIVEDLKKLLNNDHKFNFKMMSFFNNNKFKLNEIKFKQTMNSIFKNKEFESNKDIFSINENPIEMSYYNSNLKSNFNMKDVNNKENNIQNKPIISQYLKAISLYNMKQKGILMSYAYIVGFNFNRNTNKLIKNIYNLLEGSFKSMYCLISKPVFIMTPDKIIINLFYYLFIPNILKFKKINKFGKTSKNKFNKRIWFKNKNKIKKQYRKFRQVNLDVRVKLRKLSNFSLIKVFTNKFKILCKILSHLLKKPVELNLIRLHYPYYDNNILVNLLAIMINKIKLRILTRKLFKKAVIKNLNKNRVKLNNNNNIIPAFLSGLKIRVAGRLLTQRVIPRKSVKTIQRGALARGKINYSDVARYTNKNKRGSYSITISSGQNLF